MLQREGTRTAFIVALLVATFLLTAFMALRAQQAATYHRATAENVIRDWTRLAADELTRRADAQAGFYGTYPVLQSLLAQAPARSPLVHCVFRFDVRSREVTAPDCTEDARAWLQPQLVKIAAAPPPPADVKPLHWNGRTFVYAVARDGGSVSGFEVNRPQLAPFFVSVLATRPLVPRSLAEGKIGNEAFRFRVVVGAGEIFATKKPVEMPLAVRLRAGEGLLQGMTVEASVDREVAPLLVFGGIPRPLPIYMVTLALTSALLFIAVLQLRRERALSRMRSDFVASVSHELRTPLTQIRMFGETLLLGRVRSGEEQRRALTVIDQESRRLTQLVENVLQFSRGERGTLRLRRERIDVAAVVRETVDSFRPIAAARNVTITLDAASAILDADPDAVSQIVLNLLDNAVKYGPAGQEVRIVVERNRVIVDDAGPGIPPRERKRIWRRYERLQRDAQRAVAGAGIGLAVVRELVALHGGKAWVEESARGGARFIVELPA